MKKNKSRSSNITLTKESLVSLILERVECILKEQGLTTEPGLGDGFGNAQTPFDGFDNPGGEDPTMTALGNDEMDTEENPSAEADSLLSLDDLENMDQPDARRTMMAGLQGGGKERQTTSDLVAAILGDPAKAQQFGDEEGLPASPELRQTAADVAALSGISLQERAQLKQLFKSYLAEKNRA